MKKTKCKSLYPDVHIKYINLCNLLLVLPRLGHNNIAARDWKRLIIPNPTNAPPTTPPPPTPTSSNFVCPKTTSQLCDSPNIRHINLSTLTLLHQKLILE